MSAAQASEDRENPIKKDASAPQGLHHGTSHCLQFKVSTHNSKMTVLCHIRSTVTSNFLIIWTSFLVLQYCFQCKKRKFKSTQNLNGLMKSFLQIVHMISQKSLLSKYHASLYGIGFEE